MIMPARQALTPEHFSTVLDMVSDAVFTVDPEMTITSFNQAAERLTGYRREDVLGRRCYDVFRGPRCGRGCAMMESLRTGHALWSENTIYDRDNHGHAILMYTSALRNRRGEIVGGAKTFRDAPDGPISEYKVGSAASPDKPLSVLEASQRAAIEEVLSRHNGNQVAAARELGISRTTLWRKMRRLGVVPRRRTRDR